jgi:hypothetical protein
MACLPDSRPLEHETARLKPAGEIYRVSHISLDTGDNILNVDSQGTFAPLCISPVYINIWDCV